jgi:hypothetical protein
MRNLHALKQNDMKIPALITESRSSGQSGSSIGGDRRSLGTAPRGRGLSSKKFVRKKQDFALCSRDFQA